MTCYLREGVHAAVIGGAVVLLDLKGDSYLCLPDAGGAIDRRADGRVRITDRKVADALQSEGLTGPYPTVPPSPVPPKPTRTVIHDRARLSPGDLWPALRAAMDQRAVTTGAGVGAHLIQRGGLKSDPTAASRAAGAFWRLSPWLPVEGECLVRSGLLIRFLKRRGLDADWVFGVRLYPFMAHCWVQIDDLCLNDDVERLAAYTPLARL